MSQRYHLLVLLTAAALVGGFLAGRLYRRSAGQVHAAPVPAMSGQRAQDGDREYPTHAVHPRDWPDVRKADDAGGIQRRGFGAVTDLAESGD